MQVCKFLRALATIPGDMPHCELLILMLETFVAFSPRRMQAAGHRVRSPSVCGLQRLTRALTVDIRSHYARDPQSVKSRVRSWRPPWITPGSESTVPPITTVIPLKP
jgi:hypothetical protein